MSTCQFSQFSLRNQAGRAVGQHSDFSCHRYCESPSLMTRISNSLTQLRCNVYSFLKYLLPASSFLCTASGAFLNRACVSCMSSAHFLGSGGGGGGTNEERSQKRQRSRDLLSSPSSPSRSNVFSSIQNLRFDLAPPSLSPLCPLSPSISPYISPLFLTPFSLLLKF